MIASPGEGRLAGCWNHSRYGLPAYHGQLDPTASLLPWQTVEAACVAGGGTLDTHVLMSLAVFGTLALGMAQEVSGALNFSQAIYAR